MTASHRWHDSVLPPQWPEAAATLERAGVIEGFYLAGGTGLALQLGHRVSVDLDLFTPQSFNALALRDSLRGASAFSVQQIAEQTLHVEIAGIQVSFLHYPYPLGFETQRFHQLAVADVRDIGCMKLDALSSRGSRRDFVDLYFLLQRFNLGELLDWFDARYANAAPNRVHLSKALTYFDDAEQEPMPNMLVAADWNLIKTFFEDEVPGAFR